MNLDDALQTFIAESRELLEEMQSALLSLGAPGVSMACDEAVNAVFRAAHTIKGSAGLFGLDDIVAFTHVAESLLDEVRAGAVPIDEALIALLLACADHLRALVDAVAAGTSTADEVLAGAAVPLLVRLRAYLGDDTAAQTAAVTALGGGTEGHWHLSLRFGTGVLRNGLDPLSFLRYLGRIGRIAAIVTLADTLPPLDALEPECCHLGFEIALLTNADKATIEGVFEFVLDDCALRIVPPRSHVDEFVALIEALPESPARLGEILVQCGSVTARELECALQAQAAGVPQRLGEILVEQSGVAAPVVDAALGKQQQQTRADRASVRVDAAKLDRLVDLVGELIVAAAGAAAHARHSRDAELVEACSVLSGLVEDVRDSALELRMVKIGATFGRFRRVVHDVAHDLGKEIELVVSGEDTELDKTVVEKIADPLTHLVRNAIDHGIEPAAQRAKRGKPARGTLRLNAYHDASSIVIEVGDDGGGLNRERILAKALERGLVEPAHKLSDAEIYALVFEPGFSTADQVTNLSGRGVGMDVVKRNISALRGTVAIDSRPGRGTTITVRLPLTLAIINGFQVGVGRSVFVLPLELVEECIAFSAAPGHDVTSLRGRMLPFVRLRTLFGIDAQPPPARENTVVVRWAGQCFGLVVDTLLGESQTVIKPLSPMFAGVQGISGSGIRGSGEIALILDVPALFERLTQSAAAHPSTSVTENLPC